MLAPFFMWMEGLAVYQSSIYLGPGVNLAHLVAMVTFMGALLLVDLRCLGFGLTEQSVTQVARSAHRWLIGGLAGLVVTGIPAVMAVATQEYENNTFWWKMYILATAILWTFTVRRKVVQSHDPGLGGKAVAIVSILLWMAVAAGGRLIMYL